MMLLTAMFMLSYPDVLDYEQLYVFVSRKLHGHLINYIPKSTLNGVFLSTLLETIVAMLLKGK